MKHLIWSASVAALVLLASPAVGTASEIRTGSTATVAAGETVDDDFFGSGDAVTIAGRVTGDVYAAGQNVVVSGTIDGDLLAVASQVVVDGTVRGDVRAGGAQVTINGIVERNVTAAAQQVDIRPNGRVGGSVLAAAESIGVFGPVGRGLNAVAGTLQIGAPVGGEVLARLGRLTLTSAARIGGDLDYTADREAELPGGSVGGTVKFEQNEERPVPAQPLLNGLFDLGGLVWLLGSAVLGTLVVVLTPRLAARAVHEGRRQPMPSLGIGLGVCFVLPIVAVVIAVTIIGLPLTFALLALYILALLLAWPAGALVVGSALADRARPGQPFPAVAALLVGLIVLHLLTHVPFVGGLVSLLALGLGLGVVALAARSALRQPTGVA